MSRLFILGAGASVAHSNGLIPHARNFLQKAMEIGFFNPSFDFGKVTDKIPISPYVSTELMIEVFYGLSKNKRKDIEAAKKIDIEELLTLATLQLQVEPTFTSTEDIVKLIVGTIDHYSQKYERRDGAYDSFVSKIIRDTDNIFTFNWDTLLDKKFPDYFDPGTEIMRTSNAHYSRYLDTRTAVYEGFMDSLGAHRPYIPNTHENNNEKSFGKSPQAVYLKLHGSVDLVYCVNNSCDNFQKPFRAIGTIKQRNNCGICHETVQRYIVPPVLNKPIRDLPYIRRTWNLAQQICEIASEVVFWGYSLPPTDYWSNWLIRKVWQGNCKKITIINPNAINTKGEHKLAFINRFLPPKRFLDKKIESEVFADFDDYLKNNK